MCRRVKYIQMVIDMRERKETPFGMVEENIFIMMEVIISEIGSKERWKDKDS